METKTIEIPIKLYDNLKELANTYFTMSNECTALPLP